MTQTTIIGAGLAGSEAAWQLANRGEKVHLIEMRPAQMTKAHRTGKCAELVCSNSLRGAALTNAVGLLKQELRRLGSLIMEAADASQIPAGGALAVDRDLFSGYIDEKLRSHNLINFETNEAVSVPEASIESPVIIASGPLTSASLARSIEELVGASSLAFFDAISPVIFDESIDHSVAFRQSRYDKGDGADYLNIPLSYEEYYRFVDELLRGEKFGAHAEVESDMVANLRPFEGCMPIEEMAERGQDTLLFGPFKPVGLTDPRTGKRPFAVVQLRQENKEASLWNMVGMQTRLKHPEQLRIFRTLPGLQNAEFARLGSVHRNTFIESPKCLDATLQFRGRPGLFFAGQITGVEGYVESTAGGLVAGINIWRLLHGRPPLTFPAETAIGALMHYISNPERKDFQPMNVNFGLMPNYGEAAVKGKRRGSKNDRRLAVAEHSIQLIETLRKELS